MDLMALLGLCVLIALVFFVLQAFSGSMPPLVAKILYVFLVVVFVLLLCQLLGIPIPGVHLRGAR